MLNAPLFCPFFGILNIKNAESLIIRAFSIFSLLRMAGLEPARSRPRQILSLMRLPFRHIRTVL